MPRVRYLALIVAVMRLFWIITTALLCAGGDARAWVDPAVSTRPIAPVKEAAMTEPSTGSDLAGIDRPGCPQRAGSAAISRIACTTAAGASRWMLCPVAK